MNTSHDVKNWISVVMMILFVGIISQAQKPELITQEGHTGVIRAVAYSPNGKIIASGSDDNKIKLWDVDAGLEYRNMAGDGGHLTALVFVSDSILASADDLGIVRLWNTNGGQEIARLEDSRCDHPNCKTNLAFSPDRQTLVIAGNKIQTMMLWDISSHRQRSITTHQLVITSLAFDPVSGTLASGAKDGTIKIWDLTNQIEKPVKTEPGALISSLAFSPDGRTLISGGTDSYLRLWSPATGAQIKSWIGHKTAVNCVIYDNSGANIVSGGDDNKINVWDSNGNRVQTIENENIVRVRSLAFSRTNNSYLVSTSDEIANVNEANITDDCVVRVWDINTRLEKQKWGLHTFLVKEILFSPDKSIIATAHGATVKLWDIATGKELRTLRRLDRFIYSMAFSPDGKRLATGSGGQKEPFAIHVWDVDTGQERFHIDNTLAPTMALAFSPDSKRLASGSSIGELDLWDAATSQLLHRWQPNTSAISSIIFHNDQSIVTGSGDGIVRLWDLNKNDPSKTIQARIGPITSLDLTASQKRIAARGSDSIRIWEFPSFEELPVTIPVLNFPSKIKFSPDGNYLAVGEYPTIRVWDIRNGLLKQELRGHVNGVSSVAFSEDGNELISSSWDNTWKVWNATSGKELCTIIAMDKNDWVAVMPDGLFDGSPKGLSSMHWRIGTELIPLETLKERYYQPGLLAKLFTHQALRDVSKLENPKLNPEIKYEPPAKGDHALTVTLINRGGGIGRVQVFVNDKEFLTDARDEQLKQNPSVPQATINVDLSKAPSFEPGSQNRLRVVAWNVENYISSRGEEKPWEADGVKDTSDTKVYAIVGGISEYTSSKLTLNFAAQDAVDVANAIKLGAGHLYGADNIHLTLLSTADDARAIAPTKDNFAKAFADARKAKPTDILIVYLAGHGIELQVGNSTYCYLTSEARSTDSEVFSDPAVRAQTTITSEELTEWIKQIPALKQVVILDTCAAAAAQSQLSLVRNRGPLTGDAIRALDRAKSRTGSYILMGSAADASAYEASQYGRGLLTYALLKGMGGPALKTDQFVDVQGLFQYAQDEVEQLALSIGKIQKPVPFSPKDESFPIGQLDNDDRRKIIFLKSPKPIILRPLFLEERAGDDTLGLMRSLRGLLRDESFVKAPREAALIFIDGDDTPTGIRPGGTYILDGNKVTVNLHLRRDGGEIFSSQITGTKDDVALKVVDAIKNAITKL
jgi:WD40 repeat protein